MLSRIIVHKVGNKMNQEGIFLSSELFEPGEEMLELLNDFFLKAFKSEEQFQFYSDSYLANNAVYHSVENIFNAPESFVEESAVIARHLYEIADNPRIQGGEFFVCYFEGEETEAGRIDKIGLFKTENKNPFLKIKAEDESFSLEKDYGISLSKVDKACLIYNVSKETGFAVSVVDNNKNGNDTYWFEDFLKVRQRDDEYFHTQETLSVYKDFITKQLPQEFEVSKADQADFLNRSLSFFKEKEQFDFEEFTNEVLEDKNVIESFVNYKTDYEQEMQVSISEEFPINTAAVKKNQRFFKSIIKLDKNFHIYVHGDRQKIQQGSDEHGKFYRLYYDDEK